MPLTIDRCVWGLPPIQDVRDDLGRKECEMQRSRALVLIHVFTHRNFPNGFGFPRFQLFEPTIGASLIEQLGNFGLSYAANVLGAIKMTRHWGLERDDVILTVATDGVVMHTSETDKNVLDSFGKEVAAPLISALRDGTDAEADASTRALFDRTRTLRE